MSHLVTKESLQAMLDAALPEKQIQIVGRALVVLFKRQTAEERKVNTTNVDNGVGFTGADGESGGITAKSFIKHGTLQDWQLERWVRKNDKGYSRLSKYWRQLDEAAKAKKENCDA